MMQLCLNWSGSPAVTRVDGTHLDLELTLTSAIARSFCCSCIAIGADLLLGVVLVVPAAALLLLLLGFCHEYVLVPCSLCMQGT